MKFIRLQALLLAGLLSGSSVYALADEKMSDEENIQINTAAEQDDVPIYNNFTVNTDSQIAAQGNYAGFYWELDSSGTLKVSGSGSMSMLYNVPWSNFKGSIKSVVIGDGITSADGFRACTSLESVVLPNTIRAIEGSAFEGCSNLKKINLPSRLERIGDSAFKDCSALAQIKLPDNLKVLGGCAFMNSGLESISVPASMNQLGYQGKIFYNCDKLKTAQIGVGKGGYSIPADCFRNCDNLESAVIGKAVWYMRENCFADCKSLKNVTISDSVEGIGWMAFAGCTALEEISIPDGTMVMEYGSFARCTALKSVVIGEGMSSLKGSNFVGCTALESVFFLGNKPNFANNKIFSGVKANVYYSDSDKTWSGMKDYGGEISWNPWVLPISRFQADTPSISQKSYGIKLSWKGMYKADGYYVYRRVKNSSTWKTLGKAQEDSYKDKKVKTGKTYYYRTAAYRGDDLSEKSKISSVTISKAHK